MSPRVSNLESNKSQCVQQTGKIMLEAHCQDLGGVREFV